MRFFPCGLPAAAIVCATAGVVGAAAGVAAAADRPNILWITSEDNSPYLGCYGDPLARTPHLDRLAQQGVRYRLALANAPVCSSARTTLITGMYATSLGAQHHRSRVPIPDQFLLYPEILRSAGYYCTNNAKTDYNVDVSRTIWDQNGARAHYQLRPAGKPFFAVFNLSTSHESQVAPKPGKTSFRVPAEKIVLPPYHPDTPDIRRDWANYYDQITQMDEQAGALLAELEQDAAAEETIVVYCSDHGGALPRGKRNLHDSGTRVPLIMRFPAKYEKLAPAAPGAWVEQPVSFVDLPATFFSVCGAPRPAYYEGRAFLGAQKQAPRDHQFLYRGRMDERYDTVRALRDARFRYVRNYSPHRPWGQHYAYPFQMLPSMRSWHAEFTAGRLNDVQAAYFRPKPSEELYDVAADPFEVRNLAGDAAQASRLTDLRRALRAEMIATRDTGLIPEGMGARLAGERTLYEYAHGDAYPIERIVDLADRATSRDPQFLAEIQAALDDPHPVVRYWGATGCLLLERKSAEAKEKLLTLLDDDWADVRVVAAEALGHLGEAERGTAAIQKVLGGTELYEMLSALNTLDFMVQAGHVPLARAQALVKGLPLREPADRIPKYLLSLP